MANCSNPACDQPGTHKCSACKTTLYCGTKCQTADWPHHKEECPGHLRKVGMVHLIKALRFDQEHNHAQTLHHSDLAATKLKLLKDRPTEDISTAMRSKFYALNMMNRHKEALECAKEWYCLWLTKHTHPPAIEAGFGLIESCIHNNEFFDAALYARTTWETLTLSRDSHIPDDKYQQFIAQGAHYLAKATLSLSQCGGFAPEEKREAGQEAITLARRALGIHTQLHGAESYQVAEVMSLLASALDYFNDVDDDESIRLFEQSKAIYSRVLGSMSGNVATVEYNLGVAHQNRAESARAANDLDRCITNLELSLPRHREAARIYRANDDMEYADRAAQCAVKVEEWLRAIERAAATRG